MEETEHIIFIGQAFNREFGEKMNQRIDPNDTARIERIVSHYALTGAAGNFLGRLLGVHRLEFCATYKRTNLNVCFSGKIGKGDKFDRVEGEERAEKFIMSEKLTKYVLLGQHVAACFARVMDMPVVELSSPLMTFEKSFRRVNEFCFNAEPLTSEFKKQFFLLPHPSGINSWWNKPNNRIAAEIKLKAFLGV